jgi:hypothetical protein
MSPAKQATGLFEELPVDTLHKGKTQEKLRKNSRR